MRHIFHDHTLLDVILMDAEGNTYMAKACMASIEGIRDSIEVTSFDSCFAQVAPTRYDIHLQANGEITCYRAGPGKSSGANRLLELAIEKLVQERVSSAVATLSSMSGKMVTTLEQRAASALSSLEKAEERNMAALKLRSVRARKHISSFAHGCTKKKPASPARKRKK